MAGRVVRIALLGALALAPAGFSAPTAQAACNPCVVDAATNVSNLTNSIIGSGPLDTGVSFGVGSTYVLTVLNPLNSLWTRDTTNMPLPGGGRTADGDTGAPQITNGTVSANVNALVGQVGVGPGNHFSVTTLGALAANGTITNGNGDTTSYTQGDGLKLAFADTDTNNAGTQTVRITQAPTVGGNVLANLNVFAKDNGIVGLDSTNGPVPSSLNLLPGQSYNIQVTDPEHVWRTGPYDDQINQDRVSDAGGTTQYNLCGAGFNGGCDNDPSHYGAGETTGYRYGQLVAIVGGKYYGIGTGRTLSNLSGDLSFILWDSSYFDNLGFMNVTVFAVDPQAVPEPGTWLLLAGGLAGLAALRRKRRAA